MCLQACAVVAVADAAVTVVATGVKVAAKTVGAVAGCRHSRPVRKGLKVPDPTRQKVPANLISELQL
jgi:hypothetical protein